MLRPISLLTAHVDRIRDGTVQPIPEGHLKHGGTEFGRLFSSFNSMACALRERERLAARLAEGEKAALLGRLASGMAHEVNNPLGGMLNVVDTMRKHGDDRAIRQRSLDLLERGLTGIGNVVRATLATYKGSAVPNRLRGRDLDDLQFLLQHEIRRRHLHLVWRNLVPESVAVDGAAVRQVALNLLLNACAASPDGGIIEFDARFDGQCLAITIGDHGPGLPEGIAALLREPAQAPRVPDDDIGLGVWTVCHLVSHHGGAIEVGTAGGATIAVTFPIRLEARLDAVA